MKKFLSIFLIVALMFTATVPAFAVGTPTQKEEVVYGILGFDGRVQSIYLVNSFKGGMITDYGNYSTVSNMTSSEKLTQSGDLITINTAADRFYYQGKLETKVLPWNIAVKYKLDGKETSVSELAGKNGALAITMSITQNEAANPTFYENYMLQVSLSLDTEKCTDIVSPKAAIANAGKNKVIAHTVMPGKDANITVTANVRDFAMSGIEVTAMPLSMLIEMPDTDSLTEGMTSLSDAVSNLNDGVKKLSEGIAETDSGARKLADGSSDFADGLSRLSDNSGNLLNSSTQIRTALADIVRALDRGDDDFDLEKLAGLPNGLRQLADGLSEIMDGMLTLKNGYSSAYSALDSSISDIPDTDIDPSALYRAADGNEELTATVDQLMRYYAAAKTVKGTYAAVQEAFSSVESSLDTISGSIGTIAGTLSGMANEIERSQSRMDVAVKMRQLKEGLSQLLNNYGQFHSGLGEYMSGVKRVASRYGEVHTGIKSLKSGIGELDTGAKDLYQGTSGLNKSVADLPDTIQVEIDELTKQYDKSDFIPVSFVSNKNTNVTAVQFLLKTAPIELPEAPQPTAASPVELTFWQKLLKLFGLYHLFSRL